LHQTETRQGFRLQSLGAIAPTVVRSLFRFGSESAATRVQSRGRIRL
jgi:hypothetical protein